MSTNETTSPSKSLRIVRCLLPWRWVRTLGMCCPAYPGASLMFHGCRVFKSRSRSTIKPSGGRTLLHVPRKFRNCFIPPPAAHPGGARALMSFEANLFDSLLFFHMTAVSDTRTTTRCQPTWEVSSVLQVSARKCVLNRPCDLSGSK